MPGGDSYFRTLFHTPQTNQATAELRTAAQAQALQQALQNELYKAKKKYNDSSNKLNSGGNGLNGLVVRTRDTGAGDQQAVRFKERIDDTSEPYVYAGGMDPLVRALIEEAGRYLKENQ